MNQTQTFPGNVQQLQDAGPSQPPGAQGANPFQLNCKQINTFFCLDGGRHSASWPPPLTVPRIRAWMLAGQTRSEFGTKWSPNSTDLYLDFCLSTYKHKRHSRAIWYMFSVMAKLSRSGPGECIWVLNQAKKSCKQMMQGYLVHQQGQPSSIFGMFQCCQSTGRRLIPD